MKKTILILIALSPIAIGILYDFLPHITGFINITVSILVIVYWFFAGSIYSKQIKSLLKAIVLANSMGIISLVLYYWQFFMLDDKQRNLIVASFSQAFSAPLSYLTAKISLIFTPDMNQNTILSMEVIGLILMIIVFSIGYVYKKYDLRKLKD